MYCQCTSMYLFPVPYSLNWQLVNYGLQKSANVSNWFEIQADIFKKKKKRTLVKQKDEERGD